MVWACLVRLKSSFLGFLMTFSHTCKRLDVVEEMADQRTRIYSGPDLWDNSAHAKQLWEMINSARMPPIHHLQLL
jgi:hypothetical protein